MAGTKCVACRRLGRALYEADRARDEAYRTWDEAYRTWDEADRALVDHRATHRGAK